MSIDKELKELAALALRNAFWQDFSALVNKYLEVAKGLDVEEQEAQMGDMTSIYGRNTEALPVVVMPTVFVYGEIIVTERCETILEALECESANEIYLRGKKVFERRNNEWYFVGD